MSSFGLSYAPSETLGFIPERLERLTAIMARQVEEKKAPGVSMLIARHGKVAYRDFVGALRPGGPAMTEDAIFRIYSMTKPIVSVAAMMLVEEGRLLITDPVSKYIPAFANTKVGVVNGDKLDLAPLKRPITVQDLMRHTSGLTYGFTGVSPVQKLIKAANVVNSNRTLGENVEAMAALPLMHQPGEVWEYSLSTDVLGRVVEVVEGARLGEVCSSACSARSTWSTLLFSRRNRNSPGAPIRSRSTVMTAAGADTRNSTSPPKFESGGGGLVSTLADYTRFAAMLSFGGDARRRTHPQSPHARFHGERPSRRESEERPLPAVARPRLRPRLRGAQRSRKSADGGQRRRILLGRHDGHGVLGVAARLPVRHHHGSDAGEPRIFPRAFPQSGQRRDRIERGARALPQGRARPRVTAASDLSEAAISDEIGTGRVTAVVRCEKQDRLRHFLGLADTSERG